MITDAKAQELLVDKALDIVHDEDRLASLSSHIKTLAQHNSADRIVDEIIKISVEKFEDIKKIKDGQVQNILCGNNIITSNEECTRFGQ